MSLKKFEVCFVLSSLSGLGACTAAIPQVTEMGQSVQVRKGDAPPGMIELGPLSATHGSGCGAFGSRGSYEGAYALVKNQAAEMGAHFVRLDVVSEPHATPGCYENEYSLRGIAFRRAPRPPVSAAPPESGTSLKALGTLVGQRVVVHLKSGEVLAGTVAALTPPDDLHLVLLDQSSRHVKPTDIDKATPASGG